MGQPDRWAASNSTASLNHMRVLIAKEMSAQTPFGWLRLSSRKGQR